MKKIISLITSVFLLMLFTNTVFSAGDEENLSLLGSFKRTDAAMGESIPQDTKFAENVRKNILPNIKMPAGFKIELFAVAPMQDIWLLAEIKVQCGLGQEKIKYGKQLTGIWIMLQIL